MFRSAAYDMFGRVRDELAAARFALAAVTQNWHEYQVAAAKLPGNLNIGDFRRCLEQAERTFVLRLFAAFENVVRDFWTHGMGRTTDPDLRPLMNSLARYRNMDPSTLAAANDIRDFRNKIMHRDVRILRFDFEHCAKAIGSFISWLPPKW